MAPNPNVENILRGFILESFLEGEDPAKLEDTTPLISGGILSSVSTLNTVEFIEDQFDIMLDPDDATVENLDTIRSIAHLIRTKQAEDA